MKPIATKSLSSRVYETLRDALTSGELQPGEKLTGRSLSERMGISQTPVREALLQLVAERALVLNPNRSVMVPLLSREVFMELRDIRVVLESFAARLAAATPQGIDTLQQIHIDMIEAKNAADYRKTMLLNRTFHFEVYQLANRDELYALIEMLWARTGPYLNLVYPSPKDNQGHYSENRQYAPIAATDHPHAAVLEALRTGEPQQAEAAIKKDILEGGLNILQALPARQ